MHRLFSIFATVALLAFVGLGVHAQPIGDEPEVSQTPTAPTPASDAEPASPPSAENTRTGAEDGDSDGDVPDDSDSGEATEVEPSADTDHPLRIRAARIEALIAGTLDLEIAPDSLFVVDLADPQLVGTGGQRLRRIFARLDAPPEPEPPPRRPGRRPPKPTEDKPEAPIDPVDALANAWEAYLSLPQSEREALFVRHAARQQAALEDSAAVSRDQRLLESVTVRADNLAAFLDGTLDLEIEPRDLLTIDLSDARESALSDARRRSWATPSEPQPTPGDDDSTATPSRPTTEPAPSPEGDTPTEVSPEDDSATAGPEGTPAEPPPAADPEPPLPTGEALATALAMAEGRLDRLRQRFVDLSPQAQRALFETHEQRRRAAQQAELDAQNKAEAEAAEQAALEAETNSRLDDTAVREISDAEAEAEEAAAERAEALEAARRARTEANRIVAEERARLFAIKEAQARYSADLNRRKAERAENHAVVIDWGHRVDQLERSELFGTEREAEADPLYRSIRSDLADARARLRETLDWSRAAGRDVPRVGEGLDRDLDEEVDRGEIVQLRTELRGNERELVELEQEVAWELAQGLRDDVVALNGARLALLEMTSPGLRDEVTGFGPQGIDQVRREFEQISLELGFHVLKIPHYGDELLAKLKASPVDVFLGAIKVLLIGAGLLWWRRRSPEFIRMIRRRLVKEIPLPPGAARALSILWYFAKVRRPLELLLALWLLFRLVGGLEQMPELTLLWIVVRWLLIGQASILLIDALASRSNTSRGEKSDSSGLRIHSLRVVGLTIVAVGMLLSLTAAVVGKGAIYRWVLSTCWVLSVPVLLYLVQRWRPTIKQRLAKLPEQGAASRWGRAQADGRLGFTTAAIAAGYLLARGVGKWFLRQLGGFEITRRVLAYLFRREVAKRAATTADEQFERVDAQCYGAFDPDLTDFTPIDEVIDTELTTVAELVDQPRPTFSAVVGERGLGKSTFVKLLEQRLGPDQIEVIGCPDDGLHHLMQQIAETTGDGSLRDEALAEALRNSGAHTFAIDDAQRLITPSVRGLRPLDQLIAFARLVGGEVSWVITMDAAAWNYLRRARGDRVFFEHVVTLPRWTEAQLGALIRSRCDAAEISPSFEGLVVPRADPLDSPEAERSETGYYRLLWDFSRGNPAVAQHAFRESLFLAGADRTVVRLFEEPVATEIETLSPPLLFVLRAIVQLELAREHEVVAATLLPNSDVSDALRFCLSRGYIEPVEAGVRVTWRWYRTITAVLQRQHLLSIS